MGVEVHQSEMMQHAVIEARRRIDMGLDRHRDRTGESARQVVRPRAGRRPVAGEIDIVGDDDHPFDAVEHGRVGADQLRHHLLGHLDQQIAVRVIVIALVVIEGDRPAERRHQSGLAVAHLADVGAHLHHQRLQVGQRRLEGHVAEFDADHQRVLRAKRARRIDQVGGDDERIALVRIADVDRGAAHADGPVAGRRRVDQNHLDVVHRVGGAAGGRDASRENVAEERLGAAGRHDLQIEVVDDGIRAVGSRRRIAPHQRHLEALRVGRDVDLMRARLAGEQSVGVAGIPDAQVERAAGEEQDIVQPDQAPAFPVAREAGDAGHVEGAVQQRRLQQRAGRNECVVRLPRSGRIPALGVVLPHQSRAACRRGRRPACRATALLQRTGRAEQRRRDGAAGRHDLGFAPAVGGRPVVAVAEVHLVGIAPGGGNAQRVLGGAGRPDRFADIARRAEHEVVFVVPDEGVDVGGALAVLRVRLVVPAIGVDGGAVGGRAAQVVEQRCRRAADVATASKGETRGPGHAAVCVCARGIEIVSGRDAGHERPVRSGRASGCIAKTDHLAVRRAHGVVGVVAEKTVSDIDGGIDHADDLALAVKPLSPDRRGRRRARLHRPGGVPVVELDFADLLDPANLFQLRNCGDLVA